MATQLETILAGFGLQDLVPRFRDHALDDAWLGDLTDENLRELGVEKIGLRKRLLAAFAGRELPGEPVVAPPEGGEEFPSQGDPAAATREAPFVNTLGVPFVPIPGSRTLFAIWPVRVRDWAVFCAATGAEQAACDFPQGSEHPAVNVTWAEAVTFCEWLTARERAKGVMAAGLGYRLPQDLEWSAAVGLSFEAGILPKERSGRAKGYPWGNGFPPPRGAGNYHQVLGADDFPETSPVGSFAPNGLGLYDLGGNVWEWCVEEYDRETHHRVARGASCFNDDDEYLLSSYRDKSDPERRRNNHGFRLALASLGEKDDWF